MKYSLLHGNVQYVLQLNLKILAMVKKQHVNHVIMKNLLKQLKEVHLVAVMIVLVKENIDT